MNRPIAGYQKKMVTLVTEELWQDPFIGQLQSKKYKEKISKKIIESVALLYTNRTHRSLASGYYKQSLLHKTLMLDKNQNNHQFSHLTHEIRIYS
jgi:hypothetical protein